MPGRIRVNGHANTLRLPRGEMKHTRTVETGVVSGLRVNPESLLGDSSSLLPLSECPNSRLQSSELLFESFEGHHLLGAGSDDTG